MRRRTVKPKPFRHQPHRRAFSEVSIYSFLILLYHAHRVFKVTLRPTTTTSRLTTRVLRATSTLTNQRTESRDEDHDGGKDFSDGLFKAKHFSERQYTENGHTNRNNAGKDSSDGGFRRVALLEGGGPSLRIGLVDGADELVDERRSLGGAGRGVRIDTL